MKALAIVALIFGLGAAASSVYAFVETRPNYDSNKARAASSSAWRAPAWRSSSCPSLS